jgi:hypothetical protein
LAVSQTEIHFDAILTRVAAGETLTSVLRSRPDFPNRSGFDAYLRTHPGLRASLDAARPLSGQALVRAKFDDILAAIRNGATAEGAVESFGGTGVSFFKVIRSDPAAKARFVAATAEREDGVNALGKSATGRWSESDYDRALDALRAAPKLGFHRVLIDGMPTPFLLLDKARRDPAFRDRLADVVGDRAKRRAGMKRPPPRQYAIGLLRRACMELDVYRRADATVSKFDPADRDDGVSEIILAVLEGALEVEEIKAKGRRLASRAVFGTRWRDVSLDAPFHDSSNAETLGDSIANDDPILFY